MPSGRESLNAVLEWKRVTEFGENAKKVCAKVAVTAMVHAGVKLCLIRVDINSDVLFPVVAMVDSRIAYTNFTMRITSIQTKNHPLCKIF